MLTPSMSLPSPPSLPSLLARIYSMQVTMGGEGIQHCTPPLSNDSVLTREYDGMSVYSPPSVCSLDYPTLTVVHGDLHTASCTAEEVANSGDEGLSKAVVGVPAKFQVVARDAFGNIRFAAPVFLLLCF